MSAIRPMHHQIGAIFSTPATQSSASSNVQLWRPAQEVLQFLTECMLPTPAISTPESGSDCIFRDLDHNMSIAAADLKRHPPARWEPPEQMKISHPSAPSGEVDDGSHAREMESSVCIPPSIKEMESQEMGSILIDHSAPPPLEPSSPVAGKLTMVGFKGSPNLEAGVWESAPAPGVSIQGHGGNASLASDWLLQGSSSVEKEEGTIGCSEKDHPQPLDLLMNAIRVASKGSKPGDAEGQAERQRVEVGGHPSLEGEKRVAIFVHGLVPFSQKRANRRAKGFHLHSQNSQREDKEKPEASNAAHGTSFHKEESPEDGWLYEKHGKQASLESILYGDSGLPIRAKRGRTQALSSAYPHTTVSATYKRSRSKSFKCSSKIWTFV